MKQNAGAGRAAGIAHLRPGMSSRAIAWLAVLPLAKVAPTSWHEGPDSGKCDVWLHTTSPSGRAVPAGVHAHQGGSRGHKRFRLRSASAFSWLDLGRQLRDRQVPLAVGLPTGQSPDSDIHDRKVVSVTKDHCRAKGCWPVPARTASCV